MQKTPLKQKVYLFLFGCAVCILLLEISLRIGGGIFLLFQERANRASVSQKGAYKIVCLGESTTALGNVYSYPSQLEKILNSRGRGIKFSVVNKGVPGTNTPIILAHLGANIAQYNPDMIITMMGINDGYEALPYNDAAVSRIKYFLKDTRVYKAAMLIIDRLKNKINAIVMRRSMANGPEPASPPVPPEDIHIEDKITMLGWYYKEQGRYAQAEAIFKKAIEANPKNSRTYFILGDYYYDRQRYTEAAKVYEQVLTITPGEVEASARLGKCYQIIGRREEARMVLKKALEVNPGSHRACTMLAGWYTDAGRYKEAEAMYKKAIEIQPNDPLMYTDLELCYLRQGKYDEAEFTLKKAIEVNPRKDRLYSALAYVYEKQGKRKLAEGFFERASRLRAETYNPVTRTNYRKLADTVLSSGIRLVCVQYPVRRIGPLEKMLKGIGGIIFVDNESVFKNALKEGRYEDYFIDCFGGDSGHCTPAGNKLLAENIANVILKELQ